MNYGDPLLGRHPAGFRDLLAELGGSTYNTRAKWMLDKEANK